MFYRRWQKKHCGRYVEVGGEHKMAFFADHPFTTTITFEGGQSVADLVEKLQKDFSPRCRLMPWPDSPPSELEEYEKAIGFLKEPNWLVDILTAALDDPTWSDSPRVEPNYLDRQKRDREREQELRERAARQEMEDWDEDEDEDLQANQKTHTKRSADHCEGRRSAKARRLAGDCDVSVALTRLLTVPKSMPARF